MLRSKCIILFYVKTPGFNMTIIVSCLYTEQLTRIAYKWNRYISYLHVYRLYDVTDW